MQKRSILGLGVGACLFWTTGAFAQSGDGKVTQLVPADADVKAPPEKDGLDKTLSIAGNFSIAQNANVVGQLDGTSFLIGFALSGTLDYTSGHHEVKNVLSVSESFARTPALDPLIKTNDSFRLESIYSYYFVNWIGAFARLGFDSSVFATNDHRAEPTDYLITRRDGTIESAPAQKKLELSGSFEPISISESIGAVLRPVESESITITMRAGFGGRQTIARGIFLNTDDAATPQIELTEADNVIQGGLEGAVGFAGKFPEERVQYGLDASVLYPMFNNDPMDRSASDLIRVGLAAQVTLNTFDWLSIIYQVKAISDPQLQEKTQVQNNLLLSFKYDIIAAPPPPPPAVNADIVKAQEEAKAANDRAAEAEERARQAEQRAKEAEEKLNATPPEQPPVVPETTP